MRYLLNAFPWLALGAALGVIYEMRATSTAAPAFTQAAARTPAKPEPWRALANVCDIPFPGPEKKCGAEDLANVVVDYSRFAGWPMTCLCQPYDDKLDQPLVQCAARACWFVSDDMSNAEWVPSERLLRAWGFDA